MPAFSTPVIGLLDTAAIFVFALTGALVAASKRQTLVTFTFFAVVAGVGGGSVRDLLIGARVFWIDHNVSLAACLAAALVVWVAPGRWWQGRAIDWLDAVGSPPTQPSARPRRWPTEWRRCPRLRWACSPAALAASSATCSRANPRS